MKNERIIASWDSILPHGAANERMRSKIREYQRKRSRSSGAAAMKKLLPIAACFVLAMSLTVCAGIRYNWFAAKSYTVTLENGEKLVYGRSDVKGEASYAYDYEVSDRELTEEELRTILPSINEWNEEYLPHATFRTETGEMLRIELLGDDIRINLARKGLPLTDDIIAGEESMAEINGTTVKTGYSVSKPNSKGRKSAVFFSEFTVNETAVYMWIGGYEEESGHLCQKLTDTVYAMLNNAPPDITAVNY